MYALAGNHNGWSCKPYAWLVNLLLLSLFGLLINEETAFPFATAVDNLVETVTLLATIVIILCGFWSYHFNVAVIDSNGVFLTCVLGSMGVILCWASSICKITFSGYIDGRRLAHVLANLSDERRQKFDANMISVRLRSLAVHHCDVLISCRASAR